jgi:SAM-dependent methyltransferase
MGINRNSLKLLVHAKKYVNYNETVTLGKQTLFVKEQEFEKIFQNSFGGEFQANYSEDVFLNLGAKTVDSLDVSNYEGAKIIHDMNKPISEDLHNKYSVVFDGGSLEHIFNVPTALQNCMNLLKVGGHFIGITPTNNFLGHGFYQFSPEFFYSVFREKFGFNVVQMLFFIDSKFTRFYEVADPLKVKNRVILSNNYPSYLFVLAEKISDVSLKDMLPQQSDYEKDRWNTSGDIDSFWNKGFVTRKIGFLRPILAAFNQTGISNKRYFRKFRL